MRASLITDYGADPFYQMAADESLLTLALDTPQEIFLRLYTWLPGAITFGYNQVADKAVDFSRLGYTPLIRRITGGRALYHDSSELTYAIAFNSSGSPARLLGSTTAETQSAIARILVAFLNSVGVVADYRKSESPRERSRTRFMAAPCFASVSRFELTGRGGKLVASAQRRFGDGVLQHGSIKFNGATSHPALTFTKAVHNETLSPLPRNDFTVLCEKYAEAFVATTGLPVSARSFSETALALIRSRRETVLKNPLDRRDIFKQTAYSNSLLLGA